MNTELTNVLNQIKQDKDENLTPQNIKKDVTVLGVTGTYTPPLQDKTGIASANSSQVITPDSNYYGLNSVTIPRVTATIDNYIKPENIKKNVEILGVTGTYGFTSETKRATASGTNIVNVVPSPGINFLEKVIIEQVDSTVDDNIKPENIKSGVNILGTTGIYEGDITIQPNKTVETTNITTVVKPDTGYNAVNSVTVIQRGLQGDWSYPMLLDAQTSSNTIRPEAGNVGIAVATVTNLQPNIIRHGYNVFGVQGNFVADTNRFQNKIVDPQGYVQNIIPDQEYDALASVTINPVSKTVDQNIQPQYILNGVNILGVTGNVIKSVTQAKVVDPSISTYNVYPDLSYTGLSRVTINAVTSNIDSSIKPENIKLGINILGVDGTYAGDTNFQEKNVMPSGDVQEVVPDEGYDAMTKVTVGAVTSEQLSIAPSKNPQDFTPTAGNFYNFVHIRAVDSDCDPNIQPENIKKNMSILGVTGTYEGDTSEYFGSLAGGTSINECGQWVRSILALPNTLPISGTSTANLFRQFPGAKTPTIDTSSITNFSNMYRDCVNIININTLDTSRAENIEYMFYNCTKLNSIPSINTSNIYNLSYTFYNCFNLNYNASGNYSGVNFDHAFYKCSNLTGDININPLTSWTSYYGAFDNCSKLNSITINGVMRTYNHLDGTFRNTNIKNIVINLQGGSSASNQRIRTSNAFSDCHNLVNVDGCIFNNVMYASYMFSNCSNLTSINNFTLNYTAKDYYNSVVNFTSYMFDNCINLKSIDNMTINLKNPSWSSGYRLCLDHMFANCTNLATININLSYTFQASVSANTHWEEMFTNCHSLKETPSFIGMVPYLFRTCVNSSIVNFSNIHFNGVYYNNVAALHTTFENCVSLEKIQNITAGTNKKVSIQNNAFNNCTNLKLADFSAANIFLNSTNHAFGNCVNLECVIFNEVTFSQSWTLVNMFYGIPKINFIAYKGINGSNINNSYVVSATRTNYGYMYFVNTTNVYSSSYDTMSNGNMHSMNEVRNITVVNMPNKLSYNVGESFDPTGMVLTAQNLLDANYDLDNHEVVETLGEEYTLSTYSIDKTTLSAGDTSVNVYVTNPLNNTKVEIPITVSE